MNAKLTILTLLFSFALVVHASAQKTSDYGMGYETAWNLITRGKVSPDQNSTYQNTILAAEQAGENDYYDGLLQGATDAWATLGGKRKKPAAGSYVSYYVVLYTYTVTTYTFTFSDGSSASIEVSPDIE
jgi:hypothetical protein